MLAGKRCCSTRHRLFRFITHVAHKEDNFAYMRVNAVSKVIYGAGRDSGDIHAGIQGQALATVSRMYETSSHGDDTNTNIQAITETAGPRSTSSLNVSPLPEVHELVSGLETH